MSLKDVNDWIAVRGEDEYGLFAEFKYKGVTQRMRWIEPGRFLMGSPEDESERYDNELQHEVELTKGYWLADTACTQDLWIAVMDENPSSYTERGLGENSRPVERVNWDDCQEFLRRLNANVPGLDLRLPTEAEWEYACRAGTRTPFSFGVSITSNQVNYNGNYPYLGGERGMARCKTVPVKSLPANPWGLFEMHGNLHEWCLDEYAPYEPGLVVDPCSVGTDKRLRVVRGGSWPDDARRVRSAFRLGISPGNVCIFECPDEVWFDDNRGDNVGFRFSRS